MNYYKMDLKRLLILYFILIGLVSFAQNTDNKYCIKKDTINISIILPEPRDINISGKRLFPSPCVSDSVAFKIAQETQVYLILERNDTLYILLNLLDERSKFHRILGIDTVSEVVINYLSKVYYTKDTTVNKLFYYKIFKNQQDDSIVIFREMVDSKFGPYFIQSMKIKDTFIHFDNLKIGYSQKDFFRKFLGIKFSYKKKDFIVFIADIKASSVSWYYRYYCSAHKEEFFYCQSKLPFVGVHYLIRFRNGKVVELERYYR